MKEIREELNKLKDKHAHCLKDSILLRCQFFHQINKLIYKFSEIIVKIPEGHFLQILTR